MQTHSDVMCPSPPGLVVALAVRRGGARGVAARPRVGCVGYGCGAERRGQEGAA